MIGIGTFKSKTKMMAERSETVGQESPATPLCCALNDNKLSWLGFVHTATYTEISVQDLCMLRRADGVFQAPRTW